MDNSRAVEQATSNPGEVRELTSVPPDEKRCHAKVAHYRCSLELGHTGEHAGGMLRIDE